MRSSTLALSALVAFASAQSSPAASSVTVTSATSSSSALPSVAPGSLGLGIVCNSDADCAGGAQCYGTTSFTIKTCGSFNAGCTTDAQCATNTCQSGTCSGFLASSLYRISSTPVATGSPTSASASSSPTDVTGSVTTAGSSSTTAASVAPGTVGLGIECNSTADCAGGAQCYGTTSFTRKTCGSFNAACTSDLQCATNTCQSGICSGLLASSLYRISTTAGVSTVTGTGLTTSTRTAIVTGTGVTTGVVSSPTSSGLAQVTTNAASRFGVSVGAVAAVFALAL